MRRHMTGLAAGAVLAVLALRRGFAFVLVTGDSMMPALAPGDRVLVRRVRLGRLRPGQVVVAEAPGAGGYRGAPPRGRIDGREWMIKRLVAVPGDARPDDNLPATAGPPGPLVPPDRFVVLGDNSAWSHDSRQIGYIPGERLLGVAVHRVAGHAPQSVRSEKFPTDAGPAGWPLAPAGRGWRRPPAAR